MANSGSFNTSAYSFGENGNRYLTFSWEVISQSVASNSTTISWKLFGAGTYKSAPVVSDVHVVIDGEVVYDVDMYTHVSIHPGDVVASGTKVISHNSDGNRTFSASAECGIYVWAANCSGSGSWSLPMIPRKSTLEVPNGTLGTQQTITIKKNADAFAHSITYTCGDASGRICTKSKSTSIKWTPPKELAQQKPQDTSVVLNFTIETFVSDASDAQSVGTNTAVATYQMPSDIAPYFMLSSSDPTGHLDTFGVYVQGHSKLRLVIDAGGTYGAWIKSYSTTFDGSTYTDSTFTSGTILQTGTVRASVTVTDSRNRTATDTKDITVAPYSYPKLTSLSAYRSDGSGNSSPNGSYVTVKFSSSVTNVNNKNGAWYKVKYKKSTESAYTTATLDDYTGNLAVSGGKYTFAADESSYDILVLVGDKIKTIEYSASAPSKSHVWSLLKKGGKVVGMAFGKLAEHEGFFELGWKLKIAGGDSVVEQGTVGNWTYRKWDSGVAECWMTLEHTTALSTAWGALYSGSATSRQNYPFTFASRPTETVSLHAESYQGFIYPEKSLMGVNTVSQTACYNICRPSSITTSSKFYINFHVTGRWK